jgi:hypothetical protein
MGEGQGTGELVFKDDGIKKVRRTIDYLAQETNLIVVPSTLPARRTSSANPCGTWWSGTGWAKASVTAC